MKDGNVQAEFQDGTSESIPAYAIQVPKADLGGFTNPMPPNPILNPGEFAFPPFLSPGVPTDLAVYDFSGMIMLTYSGMDVAQAGITEAGAMSVTIASPGTLSMSWSLPPGADTVSSAAALPIPSNAILLDNIDGRAGAVYAQFYSDSFKISGMARFPSVQTQGKKSVTVDYIGTVTLTFNAVQSTLPTTDFNALENLVRANVAAMMLNGN